MESSLLAHSRGIVHRKDILRDARKHTPEHRVVLDCPARGQGDVVAYTKWPGRESCAAQYGYEEGVGECAEDGQETTS